MDGVPYALTVPAPAKLNLGLEVLGRRADGYHDLATIFLTVSLFDELSVASTPPPRIGLECSGSDVPPQENLVWRAAEAMQERIPDRGALLKLEKRIPVAAGLLYPAFGILLSPMFAAAAMALSSVSVIANALRLRWAVAAT